MNLTYDNYNQGLIRSLIVFNKQFPLFSLMLEPLLPVDFQSSNHNFMDLSSKYPWPLHDFGNHACNAPGRLGIPCDGAKYSWGIETTRNKMAIFPNCFSLGLPSKRNVKYLKDGEEVDLKLILDYDDYDKGKVIEHVNLWSTLNVCEGVKACAVVNCIGGYKPGSRPFSKVKLLYTYYGKGL